MICLGKREKHADANHVGSCKYQSSVVGFCAPNFPAARAPRPERPNRPSQSTSCSANTAEKALRHECWHISTKENHEIQRHNLVRSYLGSFI